MNFPGFKVNRRILADEHCSNYYEKETDLLLSLSLDTFRQLVRKLKSKVEVKHPIAYFTGNLNKKFQERYFEELYEMQVC
ncbi:hypothetical protein M3204_23420 [Mesobacillus subterraneus]|uniref:hypothetical protein n=1 Tax=Mesobacillus subterraneus TaxID=285983 RepID=UPI00203C9514|nr:hypothetical protein [Mesobacillus subterraneus]MCM3667328.1 hypothetical protein [Mesobacillus subterraneus]MCM3686339.1 hypothetical protein [Mesobacillus subterraneus]